MVVEEAAWDSRPEEHKVGGGEGVGGCGGDARLASLRECRLQMPFDGREEQPLAAPLAFHRTCLIHACLASDEASLWLVVADGRVGRL